MRPSCTYNKLTVCYVWPNIFPTNRAFAFELCRTSLDSYCKNPHLYRGVIPMPSDRDVLLQLAIGLEYIHSKNVIHRDVKPANVLISMDGVIKLADFGLSKIVERCSKTFTHSGAKGTRRWLAPELLSAAKTGQKIRGSGKSDIFALGCLYFFFLVPAIHPFGNEAEEVVQGRIVRGEPVHIESTNNRSFILTINKFSTNDVSSALQNWIRQTLLANSFKK